ncbi:hypothetical protein NKH18_29065 [Streptomyces sp. M10(2022)]
MDRVPSGRIPRISPASAPAYADPPPLRTRILRHSLPLRDSRQPRCAHAGTVSAARHVVRIRHLAVYMYALLVPASVPFVLLATVMGLSWWEDHVLPSPEPAVRAPLPELSRFDSPLTQDSTER